MEYKYHEMYDRKQLEIFRAVMATGSVSGAAQRINLSQPSVSRILGDLERQFGCPLFVRKSKGVQPTPEAKEFLAEVERTYRALSSLEDAALEIARKERGSLSFGANAALSFEVVPRALGALGVLENKIAIDWQVKTSRWVTQFASVGTFNLGFANIQEVPEGVNILFEGAIPHMCVLPLNHACAQDKGTLKISDLRQERLVGLQGKIADEIAARRIGKCPEAPLTTELSVSALLLSEQGAGLPITDAFTAHFWIGLKKSVARVVSDLPEYRFALFEPVGVRRSLIVSEFAEKLIAETERIQNWADHIRTLG